MNKRHLFVIARRVPRMYESLKQSFAGHADIDVILDRRRRERRWQAIPIDVDRRARERRAMDIAALLRQLGWVVVEQKTDSWTLDLVVFEHRLRVVDNGLEDRLQVGGRAFGDHTEDLTRRRFPVASLR